MSEYLKQTKNNLRAGSIATLAALTLTACGSNTADSDKGTSAIGACPKGYEVGGQKVQGSRANFRADLAQAVTELSSDMPTDINRDYRVTPADFTITFRPNAFQRRALTAASGVFYVKDPATSEPVFLVESDNNKINDLSEQFCIKGSDLFVSPDATNAIGSMTAAGVDTSRLMPTSK